MIFSRNRAMELNSLLTSIKDHFNVFNNITILFKYSNDDFKAGYDKIIGKHKGLNINWILEENFTQDTKDIVNSFTNDLCVTFVDDEWFIRSPDIKNIYWSLRDSDNSINYSGFSLRLGDNFPYTWNADMKHSIPDFERYDDIILWDWTLLKESNDYGYPYNLNSMIRRTRDFKEVINKCSFTYPNDLEVAIIKNLDRDKSLLCANKEPSTFLNCLNVAQTHFISRNINQEAFTLEALNRKWLDGYELNFRDFYNKTQQCPTMAIEMKFINDK